MNGSFLLLATAVAAGLSAAALAGKPAGAPANAPANAPEIVVATALSAEPAAFSSGAAGPLNRLAFELRGFGAEDRAAQVVCVYAEKFIYRCRSEREPLDAGKRERIIVTIPDLDRGRHVIVRFMNSHGALDYPVELANAPQVVHEIEALPLANGGRHATGSSGAPVPNTQMVSERATTMPAMASSLLGAPPACDQIRAEWVRATATDPLFTSVFGAMSGSVVLTRPVEAGSPLRPDNLPQWTLSYPLSANRVQFIAHYEVTYRVGQCAERVVAAG